MIFPWLKYLLGSVKLKIGEFGISLFYEDFEMTFIIGNNIKLKISVQKVMK